MGVLSIPGDVVRDSIEVIASPDGRYAFVSVEDSDEVAVFNLRAALTRGFDNSDFVGTILLGQAVVGMAVSPNGKWLYATSERVGARGQGGLSVINVRDAETRPDRATKVSVTAGCGPVRVVTSRDGTIVWVTARDSDALLGFSAGALLRYPSRALRADVRVGEAPVGIAVASQGRLIVVADSDRFNVRGSASALTVIDTAAALGHGTPIVGAIPTGLFPRELSLQTNGTLFIADFKADEIQAIDTAELP